MSFSDPPVWGGPGAPPAPVGPQRVPWTPPRRKNKFILVIDFVAAFSLLGGLLFFVLRDTHHGPPHPKEWDPRVLDIVNFDEAHRGLKFKQPVFVDFLDPQAYSDRSRTEQSQLTDKDKQQLSAFDGEFRALGLSNSNINLLDEENKLHDSGTLAFYDPVTERVIIRGTEMTVNLRVTLIHEFTHVLQDQYFGIGQKRTSKFKTSGESASFRTVLEGDAVRIENEYIDTLSADEKKQYQDANKQEVDTSNTALADVPVALHALQLAPYEYGPQFVQLLDAEGHQAAVDEAFRNPPTTDEQVLDPPAYLRHEGALDVKQPSLPDGVSQDSIVDSGDFGALSWLLVLGERIDPLVALTAVDGWGGDSYVAYTQNNKTCVRLAWQGDTDAASQAMQAAVNLWVAAMPTGAASATFDNGLLHLEACDPGAGNITLNNRALDVIQIPAARSGIALDAVSQGGLSVDKGFELGNCFVHGLGFDTLAAVNKNGLTPETQSTITAVAQDCRTKIGS